MLTNGVQAQQQPRPSQPQQSIPHAPPYPPSAQPPLQQHYYPNGAVQGHALAPSVIDGQNGMRYALPPHATLPSGMIGARKTGKEIKRRTKTGCLTCRKRRIKCDEGHPTCRNCQKSKRECLGYDPIFKQQSGPAPIQPAPVIAAPSNSSPLPTQPSSSQHPAQGYGNGNFGFGGPAGAVQNPGVPYDPQFDQSSGAIDPQLGIAQTQYTPTQPAYSTRMLPQRKAKPVAIEQLHMLNDVSPSYQVRDPPPPLTQDDLLEIGRFYNYHYALGLDQVFETTWYMTRGLQHIHSNPQLQDFVIQCAETFRSKSPEFSRSRPSLEARLVWQLAIMPRTAAAAAASSPVDQVLQDLLPRIDVLEYLLTGSFLPAHRIPAPPPRHHLHDPSSGAQGSHSGPNDDPSNTSAAKLYSQFLFWNQLGILVSLRDDSPDLAVHSQVSNSLDTIRGVLHVIESRDVLYSLAIVRHIGGRMEMFTPYRRVVAADVPGASAEQQQQQQQEVEKLEVARIFVEREDSNGLTQVIQRICGMSIRSWVLQRQ
ncbi:hypothetical protein K431DRAFT_221480 [Polychaeton citri CBS 116435]|uniref:Zn(2)-C6 fungal-type domain-containing protein n=1 Tax=Polychaeton citri CBS 116435 TaxID=1314669 RepID=A0A9P4QBD8_9PEZI|nr:hypothetical protein K431DRAFT_221480 [Polychaeton citri CBS 116435]